MTHVFLLTAIDLYVSSNETRILKNIGVNIRKIRLQQNLSQAQLAFEIKTSTKQIQRIENGEINTGVITLFKIAEAMNVKVEKLIF